jgi:hypothetical protein
MACAAWEELLGCGVLVRTGAGGEGGAVDHFESVRAEVEREEVLWVLKRRAEGGDGVGTGEIGVLASWVKGDIV